MNKKPIKIKKLFESISKNVKYQFSNLNPNDAHNWPIVPRFSLYILMAFITLIALWYFWLNEKRLSLITRINKEVELRQELVIKINKASNLIVLKKQHEQIKQEVVKIEKQLPTKSEMDTLLADINKAGVGRGLQFELFKPEAIQIKQYYAELPIILKLSGKYHDIASFVSDISNLSRVVTLNNISISPGKDGLQSMEAIARTFRYLDANEISVQKREQEKKEVK